MEFVTNSPNSLELPVIDSQLQSSVGPNAKPVITIEVESPEEILPVSLHHTKLFQVVEKVAAPFDKHGNSKCLYAESKIWRKKWSHSAYREYIAQYLITTSLETATCTKRKPPFPIDNTETILTGKHFVSKLDTVVGSKRKSPAHKCKVCNFTRE